MSKLFKSATIGAWAYGGPGNLIAFHNRRYLGLAWKMYNEAFL